MIYYSHLQYCTMIYTRSIRLTRNKKVHGKEFKLYLLYYFVIIFPLPSVEYIKIPRLLSILLPILSLSLSFSHLTLTQSRSSSLSPSHPHHVNPLSPLPPSLISLSPLGNPPLLSLCHFPFLVSHPTVPSR